ncbi:MAG: tetratricopeptide repeat protein, partial [Myxococcota bacterium]|nr:tetratricopeptide repeat protein [Myxococcota bacterium]
MMRALVRPVLALLVLGLSGVADAKPATRAAGRQATAEETEAVAAPTMEERQAVFGAIDAAFKAGRMAEVADRLVDVVQADEHAAFHAEAYARLGGILERLDLPYAALMAHERALATDAELASGSAKDAIALADKVGDTALLETVFSANVGLDVDDATRSRMAYLAAREAHAKGNLGTAAAILRMVAKTDPYFPEAKTLEGVILARQGKPESALAPLLTAQAAARTAKRGKKFDNVTTLNIARSYYAAENWPRAIEYYAQLPRGSRQWVDALFERAWAHFRMSDTNGALALLQVHESPFFQDWYFPEATLLRAHSLFLMCKFPEASRSIDGFVARYTPMRETLAAVGARAPADVFSQMRRHIEDEGAGDLPEMVTWRFETEDRFRDSLRAVASAEDELARMRNVSANPFTEWAGDRIAARRDTLVREEGARIQDRAREMEAELMQMLGDAEINKLDLMQMEQRLYEMSAAKGKAVQARETVSRKKRVKPDQRWWPWQGEYWQDEVGY